MTTERDEALSLVGDAVRAGARLSVACRELGLDARTVQRWRARDTGDQRRGPKAKPVQALSSAERARVLDVANSAEFRDASPKVIVPTLADRGEYVASESTFYRVLRGADALVHRGRAKPRKTTRPAEVVTSNPCEVWSWDITYLPSQVRGRFFYLYLFVDVWSRRIMRAGVHETECAELAATAFASACGEHDVAPDSLTLHSDNGAAMKGATMLATLRDLGVVASFSRPSVSDDNAFSEALFRTLKYVPSYPHMPFASRDAAWAWVERFVAWYNFEHLHSAIGFVTPNPRHQDEDIGLLAARRAVYAAARARNPARWSGHTRAWDAPGLVPFNPRDASTRARAASVRRSGAHSTTSMVPSTALAAAQTSRWHHAQRDVVM
jgi:transposase InsO family protein